MESERHLRIDVEEVLRDLSKMLGEGRTERSAQAIHQRFRTYVEWTEGEGLQCLPGEPESVLRFLSELEERGRKSSTIRMYASAISTVHEVYELPNPLKHPLVEEAMHRLRYGVGHNQRETLALSYRELQDVLQTLESPRPRQFGWTEYPDETQERARTEKALLLVMTQAGLRGSETVNLEWQDIHEKQDGSGIVHIRSGHAARFGLDVLVAVKPNCVRALSSLRFHRGGASEDKVFEMSAWQIPRHLRTMCKSAGLDPTHVNGDTPRQSLIRIMVENGAPLEIIQRHARLRVQSMLMLFSNEEMALQAIKWL